MLQSIKYRSGKLEILNQLLLPFEQKYELVRNTNDGYHVIKAMKVRGAPLIAIVAILSLGVELLETKNNDFEFIKDRLLFLKQSRPTAVNLTKAIDEILVFIKTSTNHIEKYMEYAHQMLANDVKDNMNISKNGTDYLKQFFNNKKLKVLTHCNTGSLATCGWVPILIGNSSRYDSRFTQTRLFIARLLYRNKTL